MLVCAMDSSEKDLSTALEVQQSIEHFKEQYLHSLKRSLSRTLSSPSNSFLSSPSSPAYLRRGSPSNVGTRRVSLSSLSSIEENLLSSPGTQDHILRGPATRSGSLSSSLARPGNLRIRDYESSLESSGSIGISNDTFEDISDRTKFKDKYISSLGLMHKYRTQKSLPCLKDRVAEFETLVTKSTSSKHMEVALSNSKNPEHHNVSLNSQERLEPTEINKHHSHITSAHTCPSCLILPSAVQSCKTIHICDPEDSDQKHNILLDDAHSIGRYTLCDSCFSDKHSPDSSNYSQLTPDDSTVSFPLHASCTSLSSPAGDLAPCYRAEIRNQVNTADPLDLRRDIFEKQSGDTISALDQNVIKHSHFSFEQAAIHKAYTEKEKAFILESMRKSGGRQQRTRSLDSCFNLQTEASSDVLASKSPQQPPLLCKPTQSVTNIISIFEAVHHSEPKVQSLRPDVHANVRMSGGCHKETHNEIEECLSGKEQLKTMEFSCDTITDIVDLDYRHSVDSCFSGPNESFQGKHGVEGRPFREASDFNTVHCNNSVLLKSSANLRKVDMMFQTGHKAENDRNNNVEMANCVPQADVSALSQREVDGTDHTQPCMYLRQRYGQSLAESHRCTCTDPSRHHSNEITSLDLSHNESTAIPQDVGHGRDSSFTKHPHSNLDCILATTGTPDVLDASCGVSHCDFSAANKTDAADHKPYLINTLIVQSQSDREINSNIVETTATVAWHEKALVSTDVVDRSKCVAKNRNEKTGEPDTSLDDIYSLANVDADCGEGNLTTTINTTLRNDEENMSDETWPQLHCILPHCDVNEDESSSDVKDTAIYLDKSNRVCNTNKYEANFEQKLSAKHILQDAPDGELSFLPYFDNNLIDKSHDDKSKDYLTVDYNEPSEKPNMPVYFHSNDGCVSPFAECEGPPCSKSSITTVSTFVDSLVDSTLFECLLLVSNHFKEVAFVIPCHDRRELAEIDCCLNTTLATGDDRDTAARGKLSQNDYIEPVNENNVTGCTPSCDLASLQAGWTSGMEVVNCLSSPVAVQSCFPGSRNVCCTSAGLDNIDHKPNDVTPEQAENLPVSKSGVLCARASYSDISDSVDSFYSGSSEIAESFQSAEDMDMCVDNDDHTLSTHDEVWTIGHTNNNVDGSKNEHISKSLDICTEQSQCFSNSEGIMDMTVVNVNQSDCSADLCDSGNIWWNNGSDLVAPSNDNIKNRNCAYDWSYMIDTPADLPAQDMFEEGPKLYSIMDTTTDTGELEFLEHVEDDQSYCLNVLGTFGNATSMDAKDNTYAPAELVDVCINTVEGGDTNNTINTPIISDNVSNEKLSLDRTPEADVQKKIGNSFRVTDGPVNYVLLQTVEDKSHEGTIDGGSHERISTELSGDICSKDSGKDFSSENVDINISHTKSPQCCRMHVDEEHSERVMSVETFNNSVDITDACPDYCNLTPILVSKASLGCQTHSLSDLSVIIKQVQESANNRTGNIIVDGAIFTESSDQHSTKARHSHDDFDDSGMNEHTSYTSFCDTDCDNNTESGDSDSMDIDSLEEDTDGSKNGHIIVGTGNSTTTAVKTSSTSSSSSGKPLSPPAPCRLQNESHHLRSADKASLSELTASQPGEYSSFHAEGFNDPMTLDQGLAQKQIQSTLCSQEHKPTVKDRLWKEAEDVATSSGNTSIRSSQNVNSQLHLDLASTEMTDLVQVDIDDISESPGTGLHRTPSAGAFKPTQPDVNRLDTYRFLERSQSDASLLKRDMDILATDDDVHLTAAESSSGQNISECNRVYLDLSRAEAFERVELGDSSGAMMRTSSGRLLETIPQDEELKTGDLSYVYASHRSFSQESSSSMEDLSFSPKTKNKDSTKYKSSGKTGQDNNITCSKSSLRSSFQIYSHSLKQKVRQLQMGSVPEQLNALTELNVLMEQAWSMPIYGKDLAYELCDILRTESALDIIVSNLASTNRELMKVSARLLEQSLTTSNRRQVAENGLELVVKMAHDARGDCELAQICTGILESLFKTSEDTCSRVIKLGGLDTITYWCRCNDRVTLKNCAIALSNLALYGGGENQQEMAKHKVPEWLFPLAFVDDDSVRYYALLAIGVLVSNKEIENAVTSSGTLALVLPFIDSHDPAEFAERDTSHRHGRSPGWLKRLIPVLSSKREEAQALAAFHFVMEAGIKSEQGRKEILYKIGAVDPLKWLASTPNRVASKLAAQALKIIGEEIPHKLSQQVPLWASDDVVHWIGQVGFGTYVDKFQSCHVDGDLLLRLTEEELRDSLGMSCSITRKRFLRELRDLKISSDYTSCDPSMLGAWLQQVGEDMSQYTYQMLHQGVDRPLLRSLSDSLLLHDCKIDNGIHRMKILSKIEELRSVASSPSCPRCDSVDHMSVAQNPHKTPIDVFISYRRSNGSQLASLLKVHLQLRGFTVFIDIEKLRAGKFDESLLESVRQAKNFIIVLTQNSLDRCMADEEKKDWVHREITAAIEAGSNIIPLLDNFKWPSPESLPEDMRSICYFNYVRWIHDYQDACVDKLEKFLRGEPNPQQRHPVGSAASNSSSNNMATSTSVSKQSSGFESPNSPPYQRAQGLRKMSSIESPVDSS